MKAKTTLVSFHKEVLYTVYQFVSEYCIVSPDVPGIIGVTPDPRVAHPSPLKKMLRRTSG